MRKPVLGSTLFALFGLTLFVSGAFAQSANLNTNVMAKKPAKIVEKDWTIPMTFEYGSTLHRQDSYERLGGMTFTILPVYNVTKNWGVSLLAAVSKDQGGGENAGNSNFENSIASVTYKYNINPSLLWKNSLSGILPTDQTMRDETSYQGAARVSSGMVFSNLWHGSSLTYSLSLTRNFHQYDITSDGKFNVRENVGNTLEYSLPIVSKLEALSSFFYSMGQTYNNELRTKFSFEAGLGWNFTKNFSAALTTTNEGSALRYNGTDSNIDFYNEETSMVKIGLTYIL